MDPSSKTPSSKTATTTTTKRKKKEQEAKKSNVEQSSEEYDEMNEDNLTPKETTFKSSVKTYRPPDGSPAVICIHTKPRLMKRLANFLQHFDRPPQQMFLEFAFVEVEEQNVAQFRYKLTHPILDAIYGSNAMTNFSLSPEELDAGSRRRLPTELTPRM